MAAAVATEESKYKRNPEVFVRPKMPAINPEKQADSCQEAKRGYQQKVRSSDGSTTCLFARMGLLQYSIHQKETHSTDRR
ncbi:hypothetical protein I305_02890 [Cryptococcus gattii E566]|uniref:Uncharacterized protein n=2 Tax=Cryptococcus gattii TaxID=37769 RepID=E6R6V1_CRYGW|nr:Hypothetical Protein CGB_E2530C [Cryptococcus gattii WM276]ADV22448.1 Hypothetical Protein CGB_E2530C [Cryptococcus gattii WM276]KIR78518.1 hypothetical protein I306_04446 [Cryptococcus gattii EJB2]KIY34698.1 hypothetical protein I305_02890 [Cryptococcus gattii E566]KJE00549.1 hypothetical protein I311_05816 [Cryptococcus gattii NT-10]